MELERLVEVVEGFAGTNGRRARVMLVGDVMVDEYIYGDAERLSPEAPVPVVQERYREQRAGGAGNVAAGLATLGAEVVVVSVCGNDFQGRMLNDLFGKLGVDTRGLLVCADRPTTSKIRLVGLAQHRHPQQMLRLDQEVTTALTPAQEEMLLEFVRKEIGGVDVVAVEDYNKGLLSVSFCQGVIAIAKGAPGGGKRVLVDPALLSDYSKYNGASTITPNRFEAERASGLKLADSVEGAPVLARTLLEKHGLETCLLTLDRHGMYLLECGKNGEHIATRPRNVYDVTGAGDMVLATLTMAMAGGASWLEAAALANIAGGLEVEKFGIVPIKREEIIEELLRMEGDSSGKVRSVSQIVAVVERARKNGQKVVFTNGVFDILHAGHVQYLEFSRRQGDLLIVGVNADESVKRLKGETRPVNGVGDRMAVLAGLSSVDYVVSFGEDTPGELIKVVLPDVLVKGEDYAEKEVVGREVVEGRGGKVVLAPFLKGRSSSNTIGRMQGK